jgi:type II secretory pathway component HofQ
MLHDPAPLATTNMNELADRSFHRQLRALVAAAILGTLVLSGPAGAAGVHKTSFDFRNLPVRSALQLIAEEGDFNLVVSDSVQGNITLRLTDVTWEQALDTVLRLEGLQQRVDRGTLAVGAAGE